MNLKSLLLCSDEKIGRVLRRTLGDLEIDVEHCTTAEAALRYLTRDRLRRSSWIVRVPAPPMFCAARERHPATNAPSRWRFWIPIPVALCIRNRGALYPIQASFRGTSQVKFSGGASFNETGTPAQFARQRAFSS